MASTDFLDDGQSEAAALSTLRDSRASNLKAAQAMMQSYSTLVSGVLIGMFNGLQPPKAPRK